MRNKDDSLQHPGKSLNDLRWPEDAQHGEQSIIIGKLKSTAPSIVNLECLYSKL